MIDFEKAFDSVEWSYIHKVLKAYNFGRNCINLFKTLYNNSQSCVINNGHFSEFFKLGRGCRQWDPLSPYMFILAIEPLAMAIKNNDHIQGIKIEQKEYILGQYADDTFLLLNDQERSLKAALETFKKFFRCSGLKINVDKTQMWINGRIKT